MRRAKLKERKQIKVYVYLYSKIPTVSFTLPTSNKLTAISFIFS